MGENLFSFTKKKNRLMCYVIKNVVKDRIEERPGDSIRRIDGGEGRGRKVRYRSPI